MRKRDYNMRKRKKKINKKCTRLPTNLEKTKFFYRQNFLRS